MFINGATLIKFINTFHLPAPPTQATFNINCAHYSRWKIGISRVRLTFSLIFPFGTPLFNFKAIISDKLSGKGNFCIERDLAGGVRTSEMTYHCLFACVLQIHYQTLNDKKAGRQLIKSPSKCLWNVVNKTQADISSFVLFLIKDKPVTNDFLNFKCCEEVFWLSTRADIAFANYSVALMI